MSTNVSFALSPAFKALVIHGVLPPKPQVEPGNKALSGSILIRFFDTFSCQIQSYADSTKHYSVTEGSKISGVLLRTRRGNFPQYLNCAAKGSKPFQALQI